MKPTKPRLVTLFEVVPNRKREPAGAHRHPEHRPRAWVVAPENPTPVLLEILVLLRERVYHVVVSDQERRGPRVPPLLAGGEQRTLHIQSHPSILSPVRLHLWNRLRTLLEADVRSPDVPTYGAWDVRQYPRRCEVDPEDDDLRQHCSFPLRRSFQQRNGQRVVPHQPSYISTYTQARRFQDFC